MAQQVEPMDIDSSVCDFDDKENAFHHNNALPRTPCTEKGYEELDVSELNMKLRYSVTPAASPMSKSYAGNFENKSNYEPDNNLDVINSNMTRSLNTTLTKNDTFIKSQKSLPLQNLTSDHSQVADGNRNVLQPIDTTLTVDKNITVKVSSPIDDENLSLPSSGSSMTHTPEATTPTREISKMEGGSPIIRGLKSVLNLFRPSQSPIPGDDDIAKLETLSPPIVNSPDTSAEKNDQCASASTPLVGIKTKDPLTRKKSPNRDRDSLVFNEDLEKELEWKDDSTIIFSHEKIPIHKLFFQSQSEQKKPLDTPKTNYEIEKQNTEESFNASVEYMDVSYGDTSIMDKTATQISDFNKTGTTNQESDSEFQDCETTFTKNESFKSQDEELNSTEDVLSHINDIVESNYSNVSVETLNGSDLKSANLSTVSIETTKPLDVSNNVIPCDPGDINGNNNTPTVAMLEESYKEDPSQDDQMKDEGKNVKQEVLHTNEAVRAVSLENDPILNLESNIFCGNNVSNVINNTVLDTVDVKSMSQIPLLEEPKVESEEDKMNEFVENALKTCPADIPLPEDDDVPSLPVMNLELENISHKLDQIAEEIPTINQHESSVSSIDMMSDERSIPSSTESSVAPVAKCSESSEYQNLVSHRVEDSPISVDTESPDSCERNDASSAVSVDVPLPVSVEENVLFSPKQVEITICNNVLDIKPEINISAILQDSSVPVTFDTNHPIVENTILKTTDLQEPMDMSLADVHITEDTKNAQVVSDNIDNLKDPVTEPPLSPDNTNKLIGSGILDENTETSNKLCHGVTLDSVDISKVSGKTTTDTEISASEIEFIKNEIEAIISNAVDVVTSKTNNDINETSKTNESVNNTTVSSNEQAISQKLTEQLKNEAVQIHSSTSTSHKEDAKEQKNSFNKPSDVKHSDIVQHNILVPEIEHDFVQNSSPLVEGSVKTDSNQVLDDSQKETVADSINTSVNFNDAAVAKVETVEENAIITPVENFEPVVTTDEEVATSENNSPFELIAPEPQDADQVKPAESLNDVENLLPDSKIGTTPPLSPKIVSKGYNYNFDEIDDPFATKTKIRMSPALESSPNQSFEIIHKLELPKKEKNNRRKSQPDKRRPAINNKKLNSTFAGKSSIKANLDATAQKSQSKTSQVVAETEKQSDFSDLEKVANDDHVIHKTKEIRDANAVETVSKCSRSQVTSSDETTRNKSEIKIPDFDDPNYDPFASKSKIRQSPTPENTSNPFVTRSRICQTPPPILNDQTDFVTITSQSLPITSDDIQTKTSEIPVLTEVGINFTSQLPSNDNNTEKIYFDTVMNCESYQKSATEIMETDRLEEKESSQNISIITSSSNNDKENTIREVNTEDEDTVEGPFLEVDDLESRNKISDFDSGNMDMINFSELPPENGDNPDAGELFIDAQAYEFLLNQNKENTVIDSGKESLFLKFDPLFAKRMSSDGVLAALKQVQPKQSTPLKNKNPPILKDSTFDVQPEASNDTFDISTPLPGPSGLNRTQEMDLNNSAEDSSDDLNITVSKPMMVVNPAVNPVVTPRNKTITPVRSNRHSLTFTSPAIAVIDRLLSMSSGNNSLMAHDTTVAEVRRDNEADLALTQLRELLADKEISVYNLRYETKELQSRLTTLESQMRSLETISEDRLKKINELNEKLDEKTKINKKMAQVVEEYERTIASLITEKELDKKRHAEERLQLIKERDEQTAHLASMEVSFSDLHSKYEKSKQIILSLKANEDVYNKSIKEFEENCTKIQNNYEMLKQHATAKLNHANEELQKINKAHEAEVLKMNAMIKRKELHITSLEETLQQKTKANEELTAICDELINKVG